MITLSRNLIWSLVAIIIILLFLAISCNRVDPTEVAFKVSNSGDYRGLDSLPTEVGYVFTIPGVNYLVKMTTTLQHVVWSSDDKEGDQPGQEITVSCLGGAGFKMDVGMNWRLDYKKASHIYLRFKKDDLKYITDTYLRNVVRGAMQDVSGTMTVDSVLNNLPFYEHTVNNNLTARLSKEGFIVENFNIQKQPIPTDPALAKAINDKIKAKQDAETAKMQLQISVAEANKEIAAARGDSAQKVIGALAEAKSVELVSTQLTKAGPQYVEYIKATRWDGKLSLYSGTTQGMFLNVK